MDNSANGRIFGIFLEYEFVNKSHPSFSIALLWSPKLFLIDRRAAALLKVEFYQILSQNVNELLCIQRNEEAEAIHTNAQAETGKDGAAKSYTQAFPHVWISRSII